MRFLSALASVLITPLWGFGQTDSLSSEERPEELSGVIITGVTRATLIKESPVAITSISSTSIAKSTENNIIDVLVKNAPGVTAVKTGPNISKPFIRGLGYNRVLTLYDGLRQEGQQWGDEHGIEVDAYAIEKAEIIKGPASLMYGSDALAGVVSLFPVIPKKQQQGWHGKLTSEHQSNNNLTGNGFVLNYSSPHFLFALRSSLRLAKNYRNALEGRVYNTNFSEKNLSAFIGYKSKPGFSYLNFTLYDNLQGIPDGSRDSLTRKFTKQIFEGNEDDIKKRPLVPDAELNSYRLSPLHQHIQHYRIYAKNSYKAGNSNIDLQIGAQQNIRREYSHPVMPGQAGMFVVLNTMNYDARYNFPAFANTEISAGINGMMQHNKSKDATDFPIPDYDLTDGGAYLFSKWKNNRLTISGGVRYDARKIKWDNSTKIFGGLSASVGITYAASENINLKLNTGRGYRAPNINEIASNGLDPGAHIIYLGNKNANPEFSLQEDVGINFKYSNFSAEAAVFNNNIQNYIYLGLVADDNGNPLTDAQGNKTYQFKQASAQLYGFEAIFSLHPERIKGFRFDNSISFVKGFNRNNQYKEQKSNGEYLPLIPPLKFFSTVTQQFELRSSVIKSISPELKIEHDATQKRYLGLNNAESPTPGYTLLNIGIGSEICLSNEFSAQLQFQVNNLSDVVYQSHLSRLKYFEYYTQSPNGKSGIYNMGRNFCMKMIINF